MMSWAENTGGELDQRLAGRAAMDRPVGGQFVQQAVMVLVGVGQQDGVHRLGDVQAGWQQAGGLIFGGIQRTPRIQNQAMPVIGGQFQGIAADLMGRAMDGKAKLCHLTPPPLPPAPGWPARGRSPADRPRSDCRKVALPGRRGRAAGCWGCSRPAPPRSGSP